MEVKALAHDLIYGTEHSSFSNLLRHLHSLIRNNVQTIDSVSSTIIDMQFLNEIKFFLALTPGVSVYFGKTLRDIKCDIMDSDALRKYEIFIQYCGPKKLVIKSVNLPDSPLQHKEYSAIEEIVTSFKRYIQRLSSYMYVLERIDQFCTVVEPLNPSFKDDYRRIFLDDRVWLHVEVTSEGLATNIHLIGQSEFWQDKLQKGLLTWDHDKDVVQNIMDVFDLSYFPTPVKKPISVIDQSSVEEVLCSICLCNELPDNPGMPQPLCQNSSCGVYFHRNCIFQWLVACAGGRLPTFGVATGSCPTCLEPIVCKETDD